MTSTTHQAKASSAKNNYYYKLFRVKRSDGRITTVSVDPILVSQACKTIPGGLKAVGALVREAALNFQSDLFKNCSSYVSHQLSIEVEKATAIKRNAQQLAKQSGLAA